MNTLGKTLVLFVVAALAAVSVPPPSVGQIGTYLSSSSAPGRAPLAHSASADRMVPAATSPCEYEVYIPGTVWERDTRWGAFGGKVICTVPYYWQVCVRPQEKINGSWINQADYSCKTESNFAVAKNVTYTCASLGEGIYRSRVRFQQLGVNPTPAAKFRSSAGARPCEEY